MLTNKFDLEAFTINSIISDTYDKLKDHFKIDELKGAGIVNHDSRAEELGKKMKLLDIERGAWEKELSEANLRERYSVNEPNNMKPSDIKSVLKNIYNKQDKIEAKISKDEELVKLNEKFDKSEHEKKAQAFLVKYVANNNASEVLSDKNLTNVISEMQSRIAYNSVDLEKFNEVLKQHLMNGMEKFSDGKLR